MSAGTARLFVVAQSHCEDCRGTGIDPVGAAGDRLCAQCGGNGYQEVRVSLGELRDWIIGEIPVVRASAGQVASWHGGVEEDLTRAAEQLRVGQGLTFEERRQLHGLVQDAAQALRSIRDLQGGTP